MQLAGSVPPSRQDGFPGEGTSGLLGGLLVEEAFCVRGLQGLFRPTPPSSEPEDFVNHWSRGGEVGGRRVTDGTFPTAPS
ncbi:MAG: hypothetical protein ACE5OZ_25960, partial [Candidatus Heimdallarchaeota archaeon]